MADRDTLTLSRVSAGYGRKVIISNIDIQASAGAVTAIVGGNGSGKSTVLRSVVGIAAVAEGRIIIKGQEVSRRMPVDERIRRFEIALVPQARALFRDLTIEENIRIGALSVSRQERKEFVERALEISSSLRTMLRRRAGTLSGGEGQMVTLACALAGNSRILLLDEPTAGLSPDLRILTLEKIRQFAREMDSVVVLVEHSLRAAREVIDKLYILRHGTVSYEGDPDVLDLEAKLVKYFL